VENEKKTEQKEISLKASSQRPSSPCLPPCASGS